MLGAVKARWHELLSGLWFVPGVIVAASFALAIGLVQVDRAAGTDGVAAFFGGQATAARVVLQTIAGSLITVTGLIFSIVIIALQLFSSQFTPRALRTFLQDRLTQVTAGTFVGVVVYCLLVLRSVRTEDESAVGFTPALSVTVALALGLFSFCLLLVFIHHVSQTIQVSNAVARIAHETLASVERLYPEPFGAPEDESPEALLDDWERTDGAPALVYPRRPGHVQRVELDGLAGDLRDGGVRLHVRVAPGDFVTHETPLVAFWPRAREDEITRCVHRYVVVASERDAGQDSEYGLRQLTDIALRSISPSVNDPTTAVLCIGYLRAAVSRLAGRALPARVRTFPDAGAVAVVRRRGFAEYVEVFAELGRYAAGDARVAGALLAGLAEVAELAARAGARERLDAIGAVADRIAEANVEAAKTAHDREAILAARAAVDRRAGVSEPVGA